MLVSLRTNNSPRTEPIIKQCTIVIGVVVIGVVIGVVIVVVIGVVIGVVIVIFCLRSHPGQVMSRPI